MKEMFADWVVLSNLSPHLKSNPTVIRSVPELVDNGIALGQIIAEGSFGFVVAAKMGGKEVAVKFNLNTDENEVIDKIEKLKALVSQFQHKNVLKFFDLKGDRHLILVMEKADADLKQVVEQKIKDKKLLSLAMVRDIIGDVLNGTDFMHSKGFVHLDLKPANIVVVGDVSNGRNRVVAKLIDFDFTEKFLDSNNRQISCKAVYNSPHFSPPEVWEARNWIKHSGLEMQDIRKTDVWAIGVTLYCLLSGNHPFIWLDDEIESEVVKKLELFDQLKDRQFFERMPNRVGVNQSFVEVLAQLMAHSETDRPDIKQVMTSGLWSERLSTDERPLLVISPDHQDM